MLPPNTFPPPSSNLLITLAAAFLAVAGCASQATQVFLVENPPETRAERPVELVVVYFGEAVPACEHRDVAMLSYDWSRDGIMTSQDVALAGLRKRAAELGASGVRAVELVPGANVSLGLVTGNANVSGDSVSSTAYGIGATATEFGARGIAYYCVEDGLQARVSDQ